MLKKKLRLRTGVLAVVPLILLLIALASYNVFLQKAERDCYTNAKIIAAQLKPETAGKVTARAYAATPNCKNPTMTITLTGNLAYQILNTRLQDLGYNRIAPGNWSSDTYNTHVTFERLGGNTIMRITTNT